MFYIGFLISAIFTSFVWWVILDMKAFKKKLSDPEIASQVRKDLKRLEQIGNLKPIEIEATFRNNANPEPNKEEKAEPPVVIPDKQIVNFGPNHWQISCNDCGGSFKYSLKDTYKVLRFRMVKCPICSQELHHII